MTRTAIAASADALANDLPAGVLARVQWTADVEVVPPGSFGIAVARSHDGLVVALIAGSSRDRRFVADLVRAFIGPSLAFNRRPERTLCPGDPFADEVLALAGDNGVQVLVAPDAIAGACLASLERLIDVDERRPNTSVVAARPLAPILRDFEGAVARGDIGTAGTMRDEAWATGRLTLINRSFLDTRIVAASGDAHAVLAYARRFRIPDLPLPAAVQHDLVRALGAVVLVPAQEQGRDSLVSAFRALIAPEFGAVFRDHRIAASPEARLAWVAHYLAVDPLPAAALREVIALAPDKERANLAVFIEEVAAVPLGADRIGDLQSGGEHAAAFAVALDEDDLDPRVRAEALRRSATSLDDPVRKAQAVETLAPDADADPGVAGRSVFARVGDWGAWLEVLFEHPDADDARKVLDAGSERWTEVLRGSDDDLTGWSDHIEALAGESLFRTALARLTQAVLPDGPTANARAARRAPVMLALTYAIAEDGEPGSSGLDAIGDLADALLSTGLRAVDYDALVDRCERVYRNLSTPPRLARWVVDLVRTVLYESAPSESTRDGAVRRLVGTLLPDAGRARPLVKAEVWLELAELIDGRDGLREALPSLQTAADAQAGEDEFGGLAGKTVLLHTLVEAAAERARVYLESQGAARVLVDSSHVGGDRIRALAARADIVVVASKAAKHAAFETIRPAAGERLHYASGKGWSSLVSAVRDALRD